jgi:RNA polymerase sigma-70 factor (ECF subfamily)
MSAPKKHVTALLRQLRTENHAAAAELLLPLIYEQLHNLAVKKMSGESPGHTLQPTALINEAYLKLVKQDRVEWQDRAHFFATAANIMRRILIDHAWKSKCDKRGGGAQHVDLDIVFKAVESRGGIALVLDVHDALERLEKFDRRQAKIVELRFFTGMSPDEIAEVLQISKTTVERAWRMASAWLRQQLSALNS